jgi:hypothetical protein
MRVHYLTCGIDGIANDEGSGTRVGMALHSSVRNTQQAGCYVVPPINGWSGARQIRP